MSRFTYEEPMNGVEVEHQEVDPAGRLIHELYTLLEEVNEGADREGDSVRLELMWGGERRRELYTEVIKLKVLIEDLEKELYD